MTQVLTTKLNLFIHRMIESAEQSQWGFELLLKRPDFEEFFDHLDAAGLFAPTHNPAPAPADQPGYVHIPFWYALNYLEAVAKLAGERNDLQLAEKVITVVRSVSRAREPDGSIRDNYHTYRVFADILGLVPTAAVTLDELELIPGWLGSKYQRGMVGHALDKGALRRFLGSELPEDWNKACVILRHCTAISWVDEKELGEKRKKPVTVVDDHWLKKLIEHHVGALGAKVGRDAANIFLNRLREVFGQDGRDGASWLWRPAVEDHVQNHSWNGPENRFVEGLRDVLLAWVSHNVSAAHPFIENLLGDALEIVRRVGFNILNQRWVALRSTYRDVLGPQLFDTGHLHELYGLLREHFHEFVEGERAATVEAIRQIPRPIKGDDPDERLRYIQRKWLSAIAGAGYEPADTWFQELQSDAALGSLPEHPDFHSYRESWSGPGPSPYSVAELLAFAEDGSIVQRLNAFQQPDSWRGPTKRALVDTLEEAVGNEHQQFLRLLQDFLQAKRPYQYGIINGFKRIWDAPKDKQLPIEWDKAWENLVSFFESLIRDACFWTEEVISDRDLTPNRDWIPPVIAEFLRSGTRNDENSYSEILLPRTWLLIKILLENLEPESEAREDAMTQAINTSKGKAIEALFSHALKECRMSDRASGGHAEAWVRMRPTFEQELAKCKDTNFEFSTLAGNYIANLDYIDHDWLRANLEGIFPREFLTNFHCALEGLAYAPATRPVYVLLVESGVLEFALRQESKGRHAREKLVERIALAFLWGDEELDGPRYSYLFESGRIEDLEQATAFFWSVSNQDLSPGQVERILCFWARCVAWSRAANEASAKLLSNLGRLSCYIKSVGDRELDGLLAVAPYVHVGYNADDFIEELDRLADVNPAAVSVVLGKVLDTYAPSLDFEDRLKTLLTKLAGHGNKTEAISYADRLRHLPGMAQLFTQLTAGS